MRSRLLLAVALVCLLNAASQAAENAAESEARLRNDVTYLASDALEGRGAGTAGLDKAADYLFTVKENQSTLYWDLARLPQRAFSPGDKNHR